MNDLAAPVVKQLNLAAWEEIVGIYAGADNGMHFSFLTFKIMEPRSNTIYTLAYPIGSLESIILQASLNLDAVGRRVAVLRTDIPSKPLIARVLEQKDQS